MNFTKLNLEPENKTFSDIMSNGKSYKVPPFQRDYSWENEHLNELWQDIEGMMRDPDNKTQHFMGYLVLQSGNNIKAFEIIDGQQRITTITLIVIAALSCFKALLEQNPDDDQSKKRKEYYHKTYLGVFDAVTLDTSMKLELNRNNKDHFNNIINGEYEIPRQRGITATNRRLNKTFDFFKDKLKNHSSKELAELVDVIGDGLLFTTITVKDDLDAYLIFETLNARGVHLSAPDLLKNYLLSVLLSNSTASSSDSDRFEEIWSQILEQLGVTNFTSFLRSYEGLFSPLKHKKGLYRFIKRERIKQQQQVMPYIRDLGKYASVYAALQNPDDSFWKEYNLQYLDCKESLEVLKLFNIKTPLTLLMAVYYYYKSQPNNFVKVASWIKVISIRYNVIGSRPTHEQETTYNKLSNDIMNNNAQISLEDIKHRLKSIYPSDEDFKIAFADKTLPSRRSSKRINYLLCQIEKHCSGGNEPPTNLTLEHVLPYSCDSEWQDYFGRDTYDEAIDRLGNIALLPDNLNKELDQATFADKKETLHKSGLKINQQIASFGEWNIDSLNGYQKWLAKQATAVWKIN